MQDRFKFRLWDKFCKTWLTDFAINQDGEINKFFNSEEALKRRFVLMQSTGLKDKNGKLIFEGDIVTVACGHFVIKYCDVCKSFQCFCDDECFACNGDYHWFEFLDDEREIIGNIHENPDFLEW